MRNEQLIFSGLAILLFTGGLVYFTTPKMFPAQVPASDSSPIPLPQKGNPKISATKIISGSDTTIIGTVTANITERAALDGAAYLTINTIDGLDIRVTYFPGEAPCQNSEASKIGFSRVVGNPVEIHGRALSEKEIATCDETSYYIKPLVAAQR